MQPSSRGPTTLVSRPTEDQPHLTLVAILQHIMHLTEGLEADGLRAKHGHVVPQALASPAAANAFEPTRAPLLASTLVCLTTEDKQLVAEVLLDVEVGENRYLVLRGAAPKPHEHTLSPREREIVRLVARGYPNKTIAEILEISPWTVNTYLRRIFAKLDVTSRAEMVAHSVVIGLLNSSH
jgi:DNA-binding CsgD family transcriptional regulator